MGATKMRKKFVMINNTVEVKKFKMDVVKVAFITLVIVILAMIYLNT